MTGPSPPLLTDLEPLIRLLRWADRFALVFLRVNVPVTREELIEELTGTLAEGEPQVPVRVLRLEGTEIDPLSQLKSLDPPLETGQAVFVTGLEGAIPGDLQASAGILERLNRQREAFRDLPGPVVFFLPDYALTRLAREAPDFWAWRSGVFEVEVPVERVEGWIQESQREGWSDYENLTAEQKRSRIAVLSGLLEEIETSGGSESRRMERAKLNLKLAELHQQLWELDRAEKRAQRAKELLSLGSEGDELTSEALAHSYHQLGMAAQGRRDLSSAEAWYRKSLSIQEELGNRSGMAASYHQLGMVAQDRGDLSSAEAWYRKSLSIQQALGNRSGMASSYHQLGMVAQDRGDLSSAEAWYGKSQSIFEGLNDQPHLASSYHQLGRVAQDRGNLSSAEDWYRKALSILEELGNRSRMASSYHQLGIVAQLRGDLSSAEAWYGKSLSIKEDLGNHPGMALSYGQLGLLAEEKGDLESALEWTVRCVSLFEEFPHPATGPGPQNLRLLTRALGLEALEQTWQKVTGNPLPDNVRQYVTADD